MFNIYQNDKILLKETIGESLKTNPE